MSQIIHKENNVKRNKCLMRVLKFNASRVSFQLRSQFRFLKHLLSSTVLECKHFKLQSVIKFNMQNPLYNRASPFILSCQCSSLVQVVGVLRVYPPNPPLKGCKISHEQHRTNVARNPNSTACSLAKLNRYYPFFSSFYR